MISSNKVTIGFSLAIFTLILLCGMASWTGYQVFCYRLNAPPEAPIYPGSTLLKQEDDSFASNYGLFSYQYSSINSHDSIVAYYAKRAYCSEPITDPEGGKIQLCSGDARPFGKYVVRVNLSPDYAEDGTLYIVEITWRKCGFDF